MKNLKLLVSQMLLFIGKTSHAQGITETSDGMPPQWGPVGYENERFYYLPDIDVYYEIPTSEFIYYSGGAWIRRSCLPWRLRRYDLFSAFKVLMPDYYGKAPFIYLTEHKLRYPKGYHPYFQKTIGDKPVKLQTTSPSCKIHPSSFLIKDMVHYSEEK